MMMLIAIPTAIGLAVLNSAYHRGSTHYNPYVTWFIYTLIGGVLASGVVLS